MVKLWNTDMYTKENTESSKSLELCQDHRSARQINTCKRFVWYHIGKPDREAKTSPNREDSPPHQLWVLMFPDQQRCGANPVSTLGSHKQISFLSAQKLRFCTSEHHLHAVPPAFYTGNHARKSQCCKQNIVAIATSNWHLNFSTD